MANPSCSRDTFVAASSCLQNFNASERTSLLIYFNALELAAIGGTNYNSGLGSGGTLETAARCLRDLPGLTAPVPTVWDLVVAKNSATSAGASVPSTNLLLATAIQCNVNFPMADKAAQILQLTCQLGRHKSYPQ